MLGVYTVVGNPKATYIPRGAFQVTTKMKWTALAKNIDFTGKNVKPIRKSQKDESMEYE